MTNEKDSIETPPGTVKRETAPDLDNSITQLERLKLQKDVLTGAFLEHRNHARHNETLRSTVNNMLIVASAAIFGFASVDNNVNKYDVPVAFLMILIGILSFFFTVAYTAGAVKHKTYADKTKLQLSKIVFQETDENSLTNILEKAKKEHEKKLESYAVFSGLSKATSSHIFWMFLPGIITLTGIAFLLYCSKRN